MGRPSRFSPEVRERAVRMVEEHQEAHASEWAVRQSVAPKIGKSTLLGQAVGAAVTGRGFLGESAACGQIAIVTEEPIRLAAAAIRTAREKDRNG